MEWMLLIDVGKPKYSILFFFFTSSFFIEENHHKIELSTTNMTKRKMKTKKE